MPAVGMAARVPERIGRGQGPGALLCSATVPIDVRFRGASGATTVVSVPPGTTLLEAARLAGLPIASACGAERLCGRCGLEVLRGADALPPESEREGRVKRRNRVDRAQRLACFVSLAADVEARATYW
jgi:ferredoxin